jgi:hypothetical protein
MLSFQECWNKARKCGDFACIKDVLVSMDTVKAGRSVPTIGERVVRWKTRFEWPARAYKTSCTGFSGHRKGGKTGVGAKEAAMLDIYNLHIGK